MFLGVSQRECGGGKASRIRTRQRIITANTLIAMYDDDVVISNSNTRLDWLERPRTQGEKLAAPYT